MTNPVEALADLEHQQWAHWTRYMLDNLTPENIERWRRQIDTPYSDLTEKEKDSDREWARKSLQALKDNVSEDMAKAAALGWAEYYDQHTSPIIKNRFKAMIDEALKDQT